MSVFNITIFLAFNLSSVAVACWRRIDVIIILYFHISTLLLIYLKYKWIYSRWYKGNVQSMFAQLKGCVLMAFSCTASLEMEVTLTLCCIYLFLIILRWIWVCLLNMDDIVRIVLLISATFCKLHCISSYIILDR